MAEKRAKVFYWTGQDNVQYAIWAFPGYNEINPDPVTVGTSKYAARYDHTHFTDNIKETNNNMFISKTLYDKLDDLYTKEQIDAEIAEKVIGLIFQNPVNKYSDLATTYPNAKDMWAAQVLQEETIDGVVYPPGVYRYHDDTAHPTGQETGWHQVTSVYVPLATATLDGLLSKADFTFIQNIKAMGLLGFEGSGGNFGSKNYIARSDHRHDGTYLRIDNYTTVQTVYSAIRMQDSMGINDNADNSMLYYQSSNQYLGRLLGNTYVRSGAVDLIHHRGSSGAAYKIWDAYNLTQAMIDKWNAAAPLTELQKYLLIDGTRAMTGSLNMNSNAINNCAEVNFSSDRRLKQNIVQMMNQASDPELFENLRKIKSSTFQFISIPDHDKVGYIAEEVKAVLPQFVFTNEKTGRHMVDYISIHVGKIALLEFENDQMKKTIERLESTVRELNNLVKNILMK